MTLKALSKEKIVTTQVKKMFDCQKRKDLKKKATTKKTWDGLVIGSHSLRVVLKNIGHLVGNDSSWSARMRLLLSAKEVTE